jgi:hypothetical protein
MPRLLLIGEGIDNPEKAARELVDRGEWRAFDGGWELVDTDPETADTRAANRRRQARFRARKRDARNADEPVTRNAFGDPELSEFAGEYDHPPLKGGGGHSPESNAVTRDASNAVTRNAGDAGDTDPSAWDLGPPLTAEEREAAQARIREIGDQLRARKVGER